MRRSVELALLLFAAFAIVFVSAQPLMAHQQKAAITRILFNPNTNNIEIMHRFYVHDAEHAASQIFGTTERMIESEESREKFASYVRERFSLVGNDGKKVELKYVGQEIEGRFLWVYQEIPQSQHHSSLHVIHNALRDLWPEQINMVNIERGGDIDTLTFQGDIELLTIEFEQDH